MAYTPSCMHACMHMALLQALNILLLASILVPGSAEELIRRAAMLSATDGTNSPASSGTYSLNYSHHQYLMKLEIGKPRKHFWALVDTGSELVWTKQLNLCDRFTSSTFTHMNCSDSCPGGCKSCPAGAMCGTCCDGQCMFTKFYGSGNVRGFMGNETLTLSRNTTDKINVVHEIDNVSFGCAIDRSDYKLLPKSADGIVGLNRGPMSLLQQLHVNKFSYCLSNASEPQQSSRLWFGDGYDLRLSTGGKSSSSLQNTSLVQISINRTYEKANKYYIQLERISIGEKQHFILESKNDKGVMMVDSGSPRSYLESTVFRELKVLLAKELGDSSTSGEEETCFRTSSKPEMVLHFKGGEGEEAKMHLPWEKYMEEPKEKHMEEPKKELMEEPKKELFCLTIGEDKKISILGNIHQRNTHMRYDLTKEKLSFVQNVTCSP